MTTADDNSITSSAEVRKLKNREYMRQWRAKNAEHNLEYNRKYAEKNKEKWVGYRKKDNRKRRERDLEGVREYFRKYHKKNLEKKRAAQREYRIRNAESLRQREKQRRRAYIKTAESAKRRCDLTCRTPPWADWKAIKAVYAECARINKVTGIKHHVDHIFPLKGKTVSGLHVHTNLQIIPAIDNLRKHNKSLPEYN